MLHGNIVELLQLCQCWICKVHLPSFSLDVQTLYQANPTIMSQSHYLCGFSSVVCDALWDPGQCSAGRFGLPKTLIYQRIGKLGWRAATFTVGSTATAPFSCVRFRFSITQRWVQIVLFVALISHSLLLAGSFSWLWFPLFIVYCSVVKVDLFTNTSLPDQIGR